MNYLQAIEYIHEICPEIKDKIRHNDVQNAYCVIRILTERIKDLIRQNDNNFVFKYLTIINDLYTKGDMVLKNSIENVFIFSLDISTAFCTEQYRKTIFSHISGDLQSIYFRQIYSHSI